MQVLLQLNSRSWVVTDPAEREALLAKASLQSQSQLDAEHEDDTGGESHRE
jgi:hypothetical protein